MGESAERCTKLHRVAITMSPEAVYTIYATPLGIPYGFLRFMLLPVPNLQEIGTRQTGG